MRKIQLSIVKKNGSRQVVNVDPQMTTTSKFITDNGEIMKIIYSKDLPTEKLHATDAHEDICKEIVKKSGAFIQGYPISVIFGNKALLEIIK